MKITSVSSFLKRLQIEQCFIILVQKQRGGCWKSQNLIDLNRRLINDYGTLFESEIRTKSLSDFSTTVFIFSLVKRVSVTYPTGLFALLFAIQNRFIGL